MQTKLSYTVKTLRDAGLEARWGRTRDGAPCLFTRDPNAAHTHQRRKWWMVDRGMWDAMNKLGVCDGFDGATLLGDFFSIPA